MITRTILVAGLCTLSSHATLVTIESGQTDFDFVDSVLLGGFLPLNFEITNINSSLPAAPGFDVSLPISAASSSVYDTTGAAGSRLLGEILHEGGFTVEFSAFGLPGLSQAVEGLGINENSSLVSPGRDFALTEASISGTAFDIRLDSVTFGSSPDSVTMLGTIFISDALADTLGLAALSGLEVGSFEMRGFNSVPEPSTSLLGAFSILALAGRRRR